MHYLDMDFIEELIIAKIKGRVIRKNMFLRLLSNMQISIIKPKTMSWLSTD